MKINIPIIKVISTLTAIVITLFTASLVGQYYKYYIGHERFLVTVFSLDNEWNIPTLFSSFILFFSSILLYVISVSENNNKFYFHWMFLSVIFFFLSIDESLRIHEMTISPLRSFFNLSGILYFSWVIPGAFFVLILTLSYLKFFRNLPKKILFLFVVSGVMYVGGALGMELVGGYYASNYTMESMEYAIITNIEEVLEMMGVLVFLYALMSYISQYVDKIQIVLRKA